VFIMNVIPQQVPASGPNFFNLDDNVRYRFHFDLNADGHAEDLTIEFAFTREIRPPFTDLPVSYAGVPPITALNGAGSEGLGLRQRYTVRGRDAEGHTLFSFESDKDGRPLIAVPPNVGPATIPDYEALAAQGIFALANGKRVFVGQREETFYIDLGSTFDTLNFRRSPPVLTDAEDADDTTNAFGVDDGFEGLNISTIAIEIPIAAFQQLGAGDLIGVYASTSRQRSTERERDGTTTERGSFRQVSRLANPLVNEVIIGTGSKDRWNATDPKDEAQFLNFYQNPRLATLLNLAFGLPIPPTPRNDLVAVLLKYPGQDPGGCSSDNPCSELLRLDLTVAPTPPEEQKRLTVLSSLPDPAGWPNGRRPNDDVTDIALRVVAGVLAGDECCTGSPHNRLGDGVNFNRVRPETPNLTPRGIATTFPFLPTPNPGRSGAPPFPTGPNEPLFR
jgi:hypothetical protein